MDGDLSFAWADAADAAEIAAVRAAAGAHLTARHGKGPWSSVGGERHVLRGLKAARILVARDGGRVVATLQLATRRPWAIDPAYFRPVPRALYLTEMAVDPAFQRSGVGRRLLEHAKEAARAWPADAIRLDAFDAPAGAGGFYARCGFAEVGRVRFRGTPLVYFEWLA